MQKSQTLQQILIAFILLLYAFLYACIDYSTNTEAYGIEDSIFYIAEAFVFAFWGITMLFINTGKLKTLWWILDGYFIFRLAAEIYAAVAGVSVNEKILSLAVFIVTAICITLIILKKWK